MSLPVAVSGAVRWWRWLFIAAVVGLPTATAGGDSTFGYEEVDAVSSDMLDGRPPEFVLGPVENLPPASSTFPRAPTPRRSTRHYVPRRPMYIDDPAHQWHLMPKGLIFRPYLAGAKESRFRSVWHDEAGQGDIWDVSLGGQVGLLRYGTAGDTRPAGVQLGIEGAGLVRLDLEENNDVMASDFRFGVPLTWGDDLYQVKFAYYHLSSHLGDEFLLKNPGYPRLNYSRDVLVWGTSLSPLDNWRIYGEVGYAFVSDVAEQWEFQFGFDYAPDGPTGSRGAPFAAVNGHLREEVDFGGNFVFQSGWAWRGSPASGMFRMGVEYYNGKSDQFSFFDDSEQKIGFGLWYDH